MSTETFTVGDFVSWNIGTDFYAGRVVRMTTTRLVAEGDLGTQSFTLRANGQWRPVNMAGLLRYGGSPARDRLDHDR